MSAGTCEIRWTGLGELSSYREVLLERKDVLSSMKRAKKKGYTSGSMRSSYSTTALLEVVLFETEEQKTKMDRALAASALRESQLSSFVSVLTVLRFS